MAQWEVRQKDNLINKNLVFQTLDWHCDDVENEESGFLEYKIFVFGINDTGLPVTLRIDSFHPFFFIEVPESFDSICVYSVRESLGIRNIKNIEFLTGKRYY